MDVTTDLFFYGTLCHPPLLRAVLGRDIDARAATLPGWEVFWAEGQSFPFIRAGAGEARGLYVDGLTAADLARLSFYEGGFALSDAFVDPLTAEGPVRARMFLSPEGAYAEGPRWDLADWAGRYGAVAEATARDWMRQYGIVRAEALAARHPLMMMRGGARVRAEAAAPALDLRRAPAPGDVVERRVAQTYANYFAVEEYDLSFRHFDGTMSAVVNRAVFISGDATVVLPYDPVRDRVLLVEQFRMGPHARGERQAWLLEAVAGRIDGGEAPEDAARREAVEEAGLALRELIPVSQYYPSPAAMGEYLYTYVGLADLPDSAAGGGGLETEAEDIRTHVIAFDRLMELAQSGEINTAPLLLLAYWLDRNRARLRQDAGA